MAALLIAGKDLRLRIRDRSAFIIGILAPLLLAFIFNLLLSGAFGSDGPDLRFGVVDEDGSPVAAGFITELEGLADAGVLTLDRFATDADARRAVDAGDISTFFHIPSGFSEAVMFGIPTIEIVGNVDTPTAMAIAVSMAEQFGSSIEAARLAVLTTADALGVPPTPDLAASLTNDPATASYPFDITDLAAATRQLDATTYFAAGMAIFFMFFTVQFGIIGLLDERREGTLARLTASPISRSSVLLGKAILSLVLGVTSMLVLVGFSTLIMGATWGPPIGVTLLVAAGVAAAVGIMGVAGVFAKTAEGAGNLGGIVAVVLGLLGGVFFPLGQGDDLLSRLTMITPHHWFLRGLGDISGGASWTAALPSAGVLAGFAVVFGTIAWVAARRRVLR